jgi:hypothetical protein
MGAQDVIVLTDDGGNMQIFVGINATDDGVPLPCNCSMAESPSSI